MDARAVKRAESAMAAKAGAVMGLTLSVLVVLPAIDGFSPLISAVIGIAALVAIFYIPLRYGKAARGLYPPQAGYPFIAAVWFLIRVVFFAGIITGFTQYLAFNHIAPAFYGQVLPEVAAKLNYTDEQMELFNQALKSPFTVTVSGVMGLLYMFLVPMLVIALVLKRAPRPAAQSDTDNDDDGDENNA